MSNEFITPEMAAAAERQRIAVNARLADLSGATAGTEYESDSKDRVVLPDKLKTSAKDFVTIEKWHAQRDLLVKLAIVDSKHTAPSIEDKQGFQQALMQSMPDKHRVDGVYDPYGAKVGADVNYTDEDGFARRGSIGVPSTEPFTEAEYKQRMKALAVRVDRLNAAYNYGYKVLCAEWVHPQSDNAGTQYQRDYTAADFGAACFMSGICQTPGGAGPVMAAEAMVHSWEQAADERAAAEARSKFKMPTSGAGMAAALLSGQLTPNVVRYNDDGSVTQISGGQGIVSATADQSAEVAELKALVHAQQYQINQLISRLPEAEK